VKNLFGFIRSFFYLVPDVLRSLLRSPETTRFPYVKTEFLPIYRGRVTIHAENCIGCGLCVRDCPAGALNLERRTKTSFTLFHFAERCSFCAQCEYSCKFDAIYLENQYWESVDDKDKLHIRLVKK